MNRHYRRDPGFWRNFLAIAYVAAILLLIVSIVLNRPFKTIAVVVALIVQIVCPLPMLKLTYLELRSRRSLR